MENRRRSSRSGSLVNTPDHQPRQVNVPTGKLFSLGDDDDGCESSNYLEANDSSATNSSCSFDAPPDVPPVPPRILNPPRSGRIATGDHLIIIDTDDQVDVAPVPVARSKTAKFQTHTTNVALAKPPIGNRHPPPPTPSSPAFENSFVSNTNSLNTHKNNNGVSRASPAIIEPPPKPFNHKLNMTNESNTSEVRRIFIKTFSQKKIEMIFLFCFGFSFISSKFAHPFNFHHILPCIVFDFFYLAFFFLLLCACLCAFGQ